MISANYANAMKEVLEYLNGIRKEDLEKISPKFIVFLKENASKDYKPNFDYTKPLKDLELMNTSKAMICFICYKYWCETEEQKRELYEILNKNEKEFEDEWREKTHKMFNHKEDSNNKTIEIEKLPIEVSKKIGFFQKIKKVIINMLKKK